MFPKDYIAYSKGPKGLISSFLAILFSVKLRKQKLQQHYKCDEGLFRGALLFEIFSSVQV